ncbi:MAG TPA: chaperonin GroEL, partial [Planctomycetota bacterium]|nr:chaperonin GroEL [Planctomycetota bacterium]
MAKQLVFHDEAWKHLGQGVGKLARAVKSTLGPRGRNAVLDKSWGAPTITKDGVTVAEEIELDNPFENLAAQLVKEVASKTSDIAGDGTTTATVLAEAIYNEGRKSVVAGANPISIERGIQLAVAEAHKAIAKLAVPVKNRQQYENIATISANNNREVGKIIADALDKVGKDGVITVEEGKSLTTEIDLVEGMQFDRGYLSPYFVTNQNDMTCEFDNAFVLVHEKKISNVRDLVPLLEQSSKSGRPLLIISEDIEGDALAALVLNKLKGILNVCAVKAPGFGDRRKEMLRDIATLCGGKAFFADLEESIEKVKLSDLGVAKKIRVDAENTTIIDGAGAAGDIEARVKQI